MGKKMDEIPRLYYPKTPNQDLYVKYLDDSAVSLLFGIGPAGSGKTLFACSSAMEEYKRGKVEKIVITRPIVCVEEDLGFLPGNVQNKMDPWTRPLFDVFYEYCSKKEVDTMLKNGVIEIAPLAYMRGRTFKRSFIIADEMQNSTPNQMLMLLTRLGENSKMVVTGDLKQSDLPLEKNGLHDFVVKWKSFHSDLSNITQPVELVEFNHSDVCRSKIVSLVLDVYNQTLYDVSDKTNFVGNNITKKVSSLVSWAIDKNVTNELKKKHKDDAALIPVWDHSKHFPPL
jgi:phosphate starvation-inducible PhoH-like protein